MMDRLDTVSEMESSELQLKIASVFSLSSPDISCAGNISPKKEVEDPDFPPTWSNPSVNVQHAEAQLTYSSVQPRDSTDLGNRVVMNGRYSNRSVSEQEPLNSLVKSRQNVNNNVNNHVNLSSSGTKYALRLVDEDDPCYLILPSSFIDRVIWNTEPKDIATQDQRSTDGVNQNMCNKNIAMQDHCSTNEVGKNVRHTKNQNVTKTLSHLPMEVFKPRLVLPDVLKHKVIKNKMEDNKRNEKRQDVLMSVSVTNNEELENNNGQMETNDNNCPSQGRRTARKRKPNLKYSDNYILNFNDINIESTPADTRYKAAKTATTAPSMYCCKNLQTARTKKKLSRLRREDMPFISIVLNDDQVSEITAMSSNLRKSKGEVSEHPKAKRPKLKTLDTALSVASSSSDDGSDLVLTSLKSSAEARTGTDINANSAPTGDGMEHNVRKTFRGSATPKPANSAVTSKQHGTLHNDSYDDMKDISSDFDEDIYDDDDVDECVPAESEDDDGEDDPDEESKNNRNKEQNLTLNTEKINTMDTTDDSSDLNSSEDHSGDKCNKEKPSHTFKRESCMYCDKLFSNISRHLERKHKSEPQVCETFSLPKHTKERKTAIALLRNKGNYKYNCKVLKQGKGSLITVYSNNNRNNNGSYLPCPHCLGFFITSDLWKHAKRCSSKDKTTPEPLRGDLISEGKTLLPKTCNASSEFYRNIISKMRDDEITECVKKDDLIIKFGERQYEGISHLISNHHMVTQKMRQLARVVLSVKEIDRNITTLQQCVLPENWEAVLKTVKEVACYMPNKGAYKNPNLALNIGNSLHRCAKILRNQAVMKQDDELKKKAEGFSLLYIDEWNDRISSQALLTRNERKGITPRVLLIPFVEEILKFHTFLQKKAEEFVGVNDSMVYRDLAEVCVVQIALHNYGRRYREVEFLTVEDFNQVTQSDGNEKRCPETVKTKLTKFESALCENHKSIQKSGNNGSTIFLLLTDEMIKNVSALLEYKKRLNLKSAYLFVKTNSRFPLRCMSALKKLTDQCGVGMYDTLKPYIVKKKVSVISQVLNLRSSGDSLLLQFIDTHLKVCKESFKFPVSALDVAKMYKVLNAINLEKQADLEGENFEDVQVAQTDLLVDADDKCDEEDADEDSDYDTTSNTKEREKEIAALRGDHDEQNKTDKAISADGEDEDADEEDERKDSKKKRKTSVKKRPWNAEEQEAVRKYLGQHLQNNTLPGKVACMAAKEKAPCLVNRSWQQVKHYVRNKNLRTMKNAEVNQKDVT